MSRSISRRASGFALAYICRLYSRLTLSRTPFAIREARSSGLRNINIEPSAMRSAYVPIYVPNRYEVAATTVLCREKTDRVRRRRGARTARNGEGLLVTSRKSAKTRNDGPRPAAPGGAPRPAGPALLRRPRAAPTVPAASRGLMWNRTLGRPPSGALTASGRSHPRSARHSSAPCTGLNGLCGARQVAAEGMSQERSAQSPPSP